jgi:hypothetical protein
MSNRVVPVFGSASLLVYMAPVTPSAAAAPLVSEVSTVVVPSATLMRRFWPVSLMTRSRSAAGLKSTPNEVPCRATLARAARVATALTGSMT